MTLDPIAGYFHGNAHAAFDLYVSLICISIIHPYIHLKSIHQVQIGYLGSLSVILYKSVMNEVPVDAALSLSRRRAHSIIARNMNVRISCFIVTNERRSYEKEEHYELASKGACNNAGPCSQLMLQGGHTRKTWR